MDEDRKIWGQSSSDSDANEEADQRNVLPSSSRSEDAYDATDKCNEILGADPSGPCALDAAVYRFGNSWDRSVLPSS